MLTKKDYCDYETCVALKELGYDGYCAAYYHLFDDDEDARNSFEHIYAFDFQNSNNIYRVGAPLLYQAQKWLREEKHIDALVYLDDLKGYFPFIRIWEGSWKTFISLEEMEDKKVSYFVNYEEALSEGIKEAVKILKEK
jgi:predicted metal-dependent phosphoesterase TrpH